MTNENAINGFETIPTLPHGMSFFARNGLISRVEQNCSHKGLTHNKWVKRIEGEATENKNTTTIEGFGEMAFVTLGVLFSSQKEGNLVRLNDARDNRLTSAEEICKRNMHLVEEYYRNKPGDTSGTNNQNGIFDHDLADCDELVHDDLHQVPQETFAHDLKERKQMKQIRTINRQRIRKVKYGHENQKSSNPRSIRHIPSWKQLIVKQAFGGGVKCNGI